MINNSQDYIFFSDFKYPVKVASGAKVVASGDFNLQLLASGVTIDNDWSVDEQRVLGSTGETILGNSTQQAYVTPTGDLVARANSAPSTLVWRVYGS